MSHPIIPWAPDANRLARWETVNGRRVIFGTVPLSPSAVFAKVSRERAKQVIDKARGAQNDRS
jgi:hypothetical protein